MGQETLLQDQARLRAALVEVLPEARAIAREREKNPNLKVPLAVGVALSAVPRLRELTAQIALLPKELFDVRCVDQLETYALALFQAHVVALAAITPPADLPALVERGYQRRRELLDDIKPLSNRGLLDMARLSRLAGGTAHYDLATDLAIIAEVLRAAWEKIQQSTPITEADVVDVELLSQTLLIALARRDGDPVQIEEAERTERQVFTLFAQAYNQAERVVSFLRWDEGDAEQIVPSIYGGHWRARREAPEAAAPNAPAAAKPAVPAPAPTGTKVPEGDPNSPSFEQ